MAAGGGHARAANLESGEARAEASFAPDFTGWLLPPIPIAAEAGDAGDRALGADSAGAADLPLLPDAPVSNGMWIPILAVILAGLLRRYLQSPEYRALYEWLYGPLGGY
jgi:hypothetical protein